MVQGIRNISLQPGVWRHLDSNNRPRRAGGLPGDRTQHSCNFRFSLRLGRRRQNGYAGQPCKRYGNLQTRNSCFYWTCPLPPTAQYIPSLSITNGCWIALRRSGQENEFASSAYPGLFLFAYFPYYSLLRVHFHHIAVAENLGRRPGSYNTRLLQLS